MIEYDRLEMERYVERQPAERIARLKKLFADPKTQELINRNKFQRIFTKSYSENSLKAAILLLADIDFLSYMEFLPPGCFYDLPVLSVEIPDNISEMKLYAFQDCPYLKKVKLSDNISEISYCAFYRCTSLTDVTLPKSLTRIASHAFNSCLNLKNIIIPEGVKEIDHYAFDNCQSLEYITLPNSLENLKGGTLFDCSSLVEIKYTGTKKEWEKLTADSDWAMGIDDFVISCTDGKLRRKR